MHDLAFDPAVIAADAVTLAELPGGTGRESVRIDWLQRRLAGAPGRRHVDDAGNLVSTFGPRPYRLAVLVHVDDVFGDATVRGITERDGWLCGPGIGDNAIAVAVVKGADMHATTERIRAGSIGTGADQLRAVLQEILELTPSAARD
jgi:putative aminopeptidase FrvX